MATAKIGERIDDCVRAEQWEKARTLIEKALVRDPDSHWLQRQLAAIYYEERKYQQALTVLLRSVDLVPDCPLTLWHLAGTFDALGYPAGALRIYTWLLESAKTAEDDSCWESTDWTDALKTDCVFRIGIFFRHLHRKEGRNTPAADTSPGW